MTPEHPVIDPAELELIRLLQVGDPEAFVLLQKRYLDRVFGYVQCRIPQREDAEDVTCEVFVAAARSISAFQGGAALLSWLVGIARRKIADHFRRSGRRHEIREVDLPTGQAELFADLDWDASLPDQFLLQAEVAAAVRSALECLPDAQQEALLLRYFADLSISDIAAAMQRSEDAVKALLRRGKAGLLDHLGSNPDRESGVHAEATRPSSRRGAHHETALPSDPGTTAEPRLPYEGPACFCD